MNKRIAFVGGGILATLAAMGCGLNRDHRLIPASRAENLPQAAKQDSPHIAQGEEYDRCLGLLSADPRGAYAFADAWEATGGGDGATHCRALAEITMGAPEKGADMMEKLANASQAQAAARASIYADGRRTWKGIRRGDACAVVDP